METETNESLLDDATVTTGGDDGTKVATETKPDAPIWHEQLSADLKGHELLSGIENVNDLGVKHVELAGKLENAIFKPGEGATEDELKVYREKMDIPEAPEGYEIKRPELPDGLDYDENLEKAALEVFHKAGMSKEAAQMTMDLYNNMVVEAYTQMETDANTARTETKAALEKEWGDEMKPNVQLAERVMEKFGDENFKLRLEEAGLIYSPEIYRTFHALGKVMSEDTLMKPAEGGGTTEAERTRDGTPLLKFKDMPTG